MAGATILDTFIVKLGFDTDALKKHSDEVDSSLKKTRESAKKTGDDIEKSGNSAADAINKIRNQALALFAVFTGGRGIKEFVEGMTQADSALGRFSASLGLAPKNISEWEGAARLAGASAANIDGAIRSLTLSMEELDATGSTAVIPWLRSLGNASGIDLVHTRGKTVLEELKNIAEASRIMIQKGGDPAQATYWLQNLGIAPDLIPLFERGGKALEEYLKVAKEYAATQKDIEASGQRTFVFERLALSLERLGRTVLTAFTPAIIAVADGIRKIIDAHPEAAAIVMGTLAAAVTALGVALTVNLAASTFAGATAGLLGFIAMTSKLGAFAAVLAGIAASAKIIHDTLGGGMTALFDKLPHPSAPGYDPHAKAENGLWGKAKDLWNDLFPSNASPFGNLDKAHRSFEGTPPTTGPSAAPGTYRPSYNLTPDDLSDATVNKIAGEARNTQQSTDAVINNMLNRVGSHGWGASGDLHAVAYAPGQYTGYQRASAQRAAYIRSRIRAIASGSEPDNTGGSNEYRASFYHGPWYQNHPNASVVGGNRFSFNPRIPNGPYAPRGKAGGASLPDLPIHPGALAPGAGAGGGPQTHNESHSNVSIGALHVHSTANNPEQLVSDIGPAIQANTFAVHANTGID
jgi:hypothetical protein